MGMRDESWCSSCGTSLPYSEHEVQCGKCVSNNKEARSKQLYEYMKIDLISLEQDLEKLSDEMDKLDMNSKDFIELDFEYNSISGQIIATRHLMSVAADILGIQTEEK